MSDIFELFFVFFQILFICIFLSLSGFLFKKFIFNEHDTKNFEENGLFGFLLIGFISLVINFFSPLNFLINNIFFILIILTAYKFNFFKQDKVKLLKYAFFASTICYIFMIYANVNTPDAFLYHLPYSSIINENKIMIGVSNVHSRFSHISIFQYISSFFNNSFFKTNGLLIPIALLTSYFLIYSFKQFKKNFKNDSSRVNSYFIFLILVFSLYSFNRYSGYGNDSQVHIYYFLTIIYLLNFFIVKKSLLTFQKLSAVCLFTFLIKPFYIISLIIPFVVFLIIRNNYIIFRSKFFVFSLFFVFFWILKNFFISACFIYPIKVTCVDDVSWYNSNVGSISISGEAWSKAWPDKIIQNITQENFNKNFNWVTSWSKSHLLVIFEKLLPILIFLFINFLFFYFSRCLKKNIPDSNKTFFSLALLMSFFFTIIWFLKFPIYRYGQSFIYILMIFTLYFIFIRNIEFEKISKFYNVFITCIIVIFLGIVSKNLNRIYNDSSQSITSLLHPGRVNAQSIKVFNSDNKFIHYTKKDNDLCGYSPSPCHNIKVNVGIKNLYGYKVYYNY